MKSTIKLASLAPNDELSPFIESYWMIKNPTHKDEELVTFPDGGIDLYFFHSEQFPLHVSLVGLETHSQKGYMPANSVLFGVRLKLLAAEYLLHRSVADIINNRVTLANGFADIEISDLLEFPLFCDKLSQFFTAQMATSMDPRKKIMSELIYQSKGDISVADIASAANWSSRQINRYFNKWLGLPLKSYCDILRFRSSFEFLEVGQLFPENGFNDQSHFIKLVKKYSSLTPKQIAQDKNDRFVQLSSK